MSVALCLNHWDACTLVEFIQDKILTLEKLNFGVAQLLSIDQSLLEDIVPTPSSVNMDWERKNKMEAILTRINLDQIKSLVLSKVDLSEVSCDILGDIFDILPYFA